MQDEPNPIHENFLKCAFRDKRLHLWHIQVFHNRRRLSMSIDARIRELDHRHKQLDAAIETERKHLSGDDIRVADLKRKKLRIKDEINQLKSR
tara:strand:- start:442 stop:720 length:279 start_codon:yes stop_codon:yes gene_type:complete